MGYSQLQQKSGFVLLSDNGRQVNKKYTTLVDKNGLIQVLPKKKSKVAIRQMVGPLKLVCLFAVLVIVFKALALINVGAVDYEAELQALHGGNVVEQAGAYVLQIDPLTSTIYKHVGPLLK